MRNSFGLGAILGAALSRRVKNTETRSNKPRSDTMPTALGAPYGKELEEWNQNWAREQLKLRRRRPARRPRGASTLDQLHDAYKSQSSSILNKSKTMRIKHVNRAKATRSVSGITAEAPHHKRQPNLSRRLAAVSGPTGWVTTHLINLALAKQEKLSWAGWRPAWGTPYVYSHDSGVYMFATEVNDLFESDPEKMCFPTQETALEAFVAYCKYREGQITEEQFGKDMERLAVVAEHAGAYDINSALKG